MTKANHALKEFLMTLMNNDSLNFDAFQQLLDNLRQEFLLDLVFTLEKTSVNNDFMFRFTSVSSPEFELKNTEIQLSDDAYDQILQMYGQGPLCVYHAAENKYSSCSDVLIDIDNTLHYGFVRVENGVYDGAVGFKKFHPHIWTDEEKDILTKLGRIYGLLLQRHLTQAFYDRLYETLRSEERMKREAEHDGLTGILNRTAFKHLSFSLQSETFPVGFAIIDIDNFKDINDQFGHEIGDKVLIKVAQLLKHSFHSGSKAIRLGGDEFAVILLNVDLAHRYLITDKLTHINEILMNPDDGLPPISFSAGTAFSKSGYKTRLFSDADCALYQVKKNGKKGCQCSAEIL